MRSQMLAMLAVVTLLAPACSSPAAPPRVACFDFPIGCSCSLQTSPAPTEQTSSCNPSVAPDAQCCAGSGWPSSGTCICETSDIYCGVVPGYEPADDAGPGADACVCSNDPYPEQVIGATCYANGTTTAGGGLGSCCMFPADAPGSLGVATCLCAAGLHTCAAGGVPIDGCSAASFPTAPATCDPGTTQVASCL
jgi:hypothetical protein